MFYLGSVAIMVLVLPWDSPLLAESPFVAVLGLAGLPGAARVMEVVVVVALLSAFNANVYGTSRMAYSLAGRGDGPRALRRVSRRDVPWVSVLVSVFFALVAVGLNWLLPEALLGILLNAVGAALLVVWVLVAVSQLQAPPADRGAGARIGRADDAPHVGLPWLTWAVLVGLAALAVLMLTDAPPRAPARVHRGARGRDPRGVPRHTAGPGTARCGGGGAPTGERSSTACTDVRPGRCTMNG